MGGASAICPDPCCHGTVRADHLLHPQLYVFQPGQLKIPLDHFRVSLADPTSGSVVQKKQAVDLIQPEVEA